MDYKEIKKLHSQMELRASERDTSKDDQSLSILGETEGWRVFSQ
jgi:hypothetical protein